MGYNQKLETRAINYYLTPALESEMSVPGLWICQRHLPTLTTNARCHNEASLLTIHYARRMFTERYDTQ